MRHMLDHPDMHHVQAATGWLELGNASEAEAELACVSPAAQERLEVIEVRWLLAAFRKDWEHGLELARLFLAKAPDQPDGWLHQAYALRRIPGGSLEAARDALLPAFDLFPSETIIPYNLACYACQLGDVEAARVWLSRAVARGGEKWVRKLALADPDLAPMKDEILRMKP